MFSTTIDPLNRDLGRGRLRVNNCRQTLVAIPAVRGSEDLNVQSGRPFADHSPHVPHDRVVKASINFVDEQYASLRVRKGECQSKHAPHTIPGTSDWDALRNSFQLEKYATRCLSEQGPPFVYDRGNSFEPRFEQAKRLSNVLFVLSENQVVEQADDFHCRYAVGTDELDGFARPVSSTYQPSGQRQESFECERRIELVGGTRPIHPQSEIFVFRNRNLFLEIKLRLLRLSDGERQLIVPNREVRGTDVVRFDRDRALQVTVREQVPDFEIGLTILVTCISPFPAASEDGGKDETIPGGAKQLDAFQDRGLSAIVRPDEQVDASESHHRERIEAAVTAYSY